MGVPQTKSPTESPTHSESRESNRTHPEYPHEVETPIGTFVHHSTSVRLKADPKTGEISIADDGGPKPKK
jgi:hypothetical protein